MITPQQAARYALGHIERPRSVDASIQWPRGVVLALRAEAPSLSPLSGDACRQARAQSPQCRTRGAMKGAPAGLPASLRSDPDGNLRRQKVG